MGGWLGAGAEETPPPSLSHEKGTAPESHLLETCFFLCVCPFLRPVLCGLPLLVGACSAALLPSRLPWQRGRGAHEEVPLEQPLALLLLLRVAPPPPLEVGARAEGRRQKTLAPGKPTGGPWLRTPEGARRVPRRPLLPRLSSLVLLWDSCPSLVAGGGAVLDSGAATLKVPFEKVAAGPQRRAGWAS